jgi:6-phosphogluconolactonase/glucosamine-6-phosphate isomerase/deaminase
VVAVKGGNPDLPRVTLTYAVLNEALEIMFLVHGKEKSSVVGRIFQGRGEPLPAQRIRPRCGNTTWLLDREAATFLAEA